MNAKNIMVRRCKQLRTLKNIGTTMKIIIRKRQLKFQTHNEEKQSRKLNTQRTY